MGKDEPVGAAGVGVSTAVTVGDTVGAKGVEVIAVVPVGADALAQPEGPEEGEDRELGRARLAIGASEAEAVELETPLEMPLPEANDDTVSEGEVLSVLVALALTPGETVPVPEELPLKVGNALRVTLGVPEAAMLREEVDDTEGDRLWEGEPDGDLEVRGELKEPSGERVRLRLVAPVAEGEPEARRCVGE